MRYSVLFVITLILVSGFIAFFGDVLGRRMGKKRLTIFNLRPRYTAIVATIITGMLISGLAVVALVAVNSQFRKVLSEGEQILAQNKRLSSENTQLSRANRSLLDQSYELRQVVAVRQKELEEAQRQFRDAAKARDAARKDVDRLKEDIAGRKRDIELLRGRKLAVEDELERRTEELKVVQAGLAQAQQNLEARQADLDRVSNRLRLTAERLDKARLDLSETNKKLSYVQSQLADTTANLKQKEEELTQAQQRIKEVEALKAAYEQRSIQLLSGDLVVRQGDEITRGTISPRQSPFGIRADLISLLEEASDIVRQRGAGLGPNGRAVSVIFRLPEIGIVTRNESECLDNARDAIASAPVEALVQVVCAENTVAGEQAPVELALYFNSLVFRKGERIAETVLDGRVSEGRVLLSLIGFLQTEVAQAAVSKGVVPVANYDPRISTGVNPRKQLEGLLGVVDQIRAKRTKVNVEVLASADIYAVGPLNMDNMRFLVAKPEPTERR